jgi:hypothetical protein
VERRELGAHAHPELRVEVRQRLVHQERPRLADDGAAHRDALALAAGELRRTPVEQLLEPEHARDLLDAPPDVGLRGSPHLQPVAEVLAHAHVRVERVALEDHRDVPLARSEVGDVAAVDHDAAGRRLLEPGDQAQERGLAAPRWADEDHELARLDFERDVVDADEAAGETLRDALQRDLRH